MKTKQKEQMTTKISVKHKTPRKIHPDMQIIIIKKKFDKNG